MAELKENLEDEFSRTHVFMAQLKSHVGNYICEMEQRMSAAGG